MVLLSHHSRHVALGFHGEIDFPRVTKTALVWLINFPYMQQC